MQVRRRNKTIVIFLMLLIIFGSIAVAGRPDKAGTAAATELLIPIGARSIAMGSSSIAIISGIEALYWNPAGLDRATSSSMMFSHMNYLGDIKLEYLAISTRLTSIGSIGFAIKSLDVGDIAVTTEDQPDGTGEITSPTFLVMGGTFSRQVTDRISVGITANYIYEKMALVSASAVAFNAGVQYSGIGGIEGLSVGATVKNIGSNFTFDGTGLLRDANVSDAMLKTTKVKIKAADDPLPSTIEIGLGYSLILPLNGRLNITSVFQNNNYSDDEYKFGAEYVFNQLFTVRGGIDITPETAGSEYIFGPSAGIGIQSSIYYVNFALDYAYRKVNYFNSNHVFTILLDF